MQRSFGTVISGNRRPGGELSDAQRAGILSCVEAGEKKAEIASKYHCSRCTIYNTIQRWNDHQTINSLPRSGAPEKLTHYQKRLVLRIIRQYPCIQYTALKCEVAGINVLHKTL